MENLITEISPQSSPAIVPALKMTYEEFLREYDGHYAEYVDGEIISNMSVTKTHDDLVRFLQALLRFFVEQKNLGVVHGEPYPMKMTFGDKIKGREPDIFFVATENSDRIKEQYFEGALISLSKSFRPKTSFAIRKTSLKNTKRQA